MAYSVRVKELDGNEYFTDGEFRSYRDALRNAKKLAKSDDVARIGIWHFDKRQNASICDAEFSAQELINVHESANFKGANTIIRRNVRRSRKLESRRPSRTSIRRRPLHESAGRGTLRQDVKDYILDHLDEMVDGEFSPYAPDMPTEVMEDVNNGYWTLGAYQAFQEIGANIDEASDTFEWLDELGYGLKEANPFSDPEKYLTLMALHIGEEILNNCSWMDEHGDEDDIEWTQETVDAIKRSIR